MDDSFRDRVDKVFGTLGSNSSPAVGIGQSQSLWRLSDEEIERRKWDRHKEDSEDEDGRGDESGPSFLDAKLEEEDLEDLSDGEEEEEIDGDKSLERRRTKCGGDAEAGVDEFLDVRSNIGCDSTLDHEEEEDEYDKVAVGTEQTGDRLYVAHVEYADYGIDEVNGYNELPSRFLAAPRDPRANHLAAKARLQEDAEAVTEFDTPLMLDDSAPMIVETEDLEKGESDPENLKSILKRRENQDSRSQKRVRFVLNPENETQANGDHPSSGASLIVSQPPEKDYAAVSEPTSDLYASKVPDYIRNPSKYTHYTFSSSDDMDGQSNQKAYMELRQTLRGNNTNAVGDGAPTVLPKSVVFTPKRRQEVDAMMVSNQGVNNVGENLKNRTCSISTEDDSQDSDISAMVEDEPCGSVSKASSSSSEKPGRRYRARSNTSAEDDLK